MATPPVPQPRRPSIPGPSEGGPSTGPSTGQPIMAPPIPPRRSTSVPSPTKLAGTLAALTTASSSAGPSSAGPSSTPPVISKRSSSTRQKRLWEPGHRELSKNELEEQIKSHDDDIARKVKKLKLATSYDSNFWTANADISRLCRLRAGMESRLQFLDYKETSREDVSEDDWRADERAENLKRMVAAYRQQEAIATKQATRLKSSRNSLSSLFLSLFTSSPQGLNIKIGVGRRDTSDQSNMVKQMIRKYCPDAPKGLVWDVITGRFARKDLFHAAHLYGWRSVESMDAIFGTGAKDDIFSPVNGLFLDPRVEKALDMGIIAIVPDVDIEPKDKQFPHDDVDERKQRLLEWEGTRVKEYKVIVLDPSNKFTKEVAWEDEHRNFRKVGELDEMKLKFQTDFRPRARYVWWTFMNAVLQAAWRHEHDEKNVLRQEVAKATRYWGTRGRYVKKNMLRVFVDELGHDIESILEHGIEDEGESGEADPEAMAVMASETIIRTQEAAKTDEDVDEDDDDEAEDDVE